MNEIKKYFLHIRPLGIPYFSLTYFWGYIIAGGHKTFFNWQLLFLGFFIWVVLLNGGTLCFNSYYDKDTGDIAFLNNPPQPPKFLHYFGFLLMLIGFIISFLMPPYFYKVYFFCFVLSLLYSHPKVRLKNILGMAELVNGIGYGFCSPYVSFRLIKPDLSNGYIYLFLSIILLNIGGYWITQIYQITEDKKANVKTFAVTLGREKSLIISSIIMISSILIFTYCIFLKIFPMITFLFLFPVFILGIPLMIYWLFFSKPEQDKNLLYIGIFVYILTGGIIILTI